MGYGTLIALLTLLWTQHVWAQDDPADVLIRAREKLLALADRASRYSCIETLDRSYFRRQDRGNTRLSCDQVLGERKKFPPKLEFTDRLRVNIEAPSGRESISWTGTPPRWIKLEDLIESGPIATGSLGTYITEIFTNAAAHYQFQNESGRVFEYSFQVPIEMSRNSLGEDAHPLRPTAYEGSFWLDAATLDLQRLVFRTVELPDKTSVCQSEANLRYRHVEIAGGDYLLPFDDRLRFILRNGEEQEVSMKFSECRAYRVGPPPTRIDATPIEPDTPIPLQLESAIDTETAAAGDPISARVPWPVIRPMLWLRLVYIPWGSIARGRIVRVEHDLNPPRFLISIVFETIEIDGKELPFQATLEPPAVVFPERSWPGGTLDFATKQNSLVIPPGFLSRWITVEPRR
jgi:hypothetical protein